MPDQKLRKQSGDYLATVEVAILTTLAVLISLTALVAIARSGKLLWDTLHQWMVVADSLVVLRVLDQLLVVLMLVEILHTVRISIPYPGHGALPGRRPDRFHPPRSRDHAGSRHFNQRR
jgi:hypothetical protein